MRTLATIFVLTAVSAAAVSAQAQTRLTDTQFIKAARCAGLAGDERFDAVYKANEKGRPSFVISKAEEAKGNAKRQARRAENGAKTDIQAELSGACAALLG